MTFICLVLFGFVCAVCSVLLNGWAFATLWDWFVVPTFGLIQLSIPAAIGIASIVSLLTDHSVSTDKYKDGSRGEILGGLIGHCIVKPLLAVVFGWIIKMWM